MESGRLDYWRKFLGSANSDIFVVIESAILLAAADYPNEFRIRRDWIAEKLFSCQLPRCSSCERVKEEAVEKEEGEFIVREERGERAVAGTVEKESKVNSCVTERELDVNRVTSNYSYDDAEALTEEMEEESQMVGEVLRIKEILANMNNESSDAVLYDSLRRLQLIVVSVDVLKATEIGKVVNPLRKHRSKEIRHLVRSLLDGWKAMVDQWVNAAATLTEGTPESMNPSVADNDEGLPSPPLDEGAMFSTQTMELSQFFDGIDEEGNMRASTEFEKCQQSGRRSDLENRDNGQGIQVPNQTANLADNSQIRKQEVIKRQTKPSEVTNKRSNLQQYFSMPPKPQEDADKQRRQAEVFSRQNRQFGSNVGPGFSRPQKPGPMENRFQPQKQATGNQKKPLTGFQDTSKNLGDVSMCDRLEAAKRKLHEKYKQAEDAKRQKTTQVMELQDIPKQGLNNRYTSTKTGNTNNRHWANGRY